MTSTDPAVAAGGLALSRYVTGNDPADLTEVIARVRALPDGLPARSTLAAAAVTLLVRSARPDELARLEPLGELVDIADRHPPSGAEWARVRRSARASGLMLDVAHGRRDPQAALSDLEGAGSVDDADDDPADPMTALARHAITYAIALRDGDISTLRDLPDFDALLGGGPAAVSDHPVLGPMRSLMEAMRDVVVANETGDEEKRNEAIVRVRTRAEALPPDSGLRQALQSSFPVFDVMSRMLSDEVPTAAQVDALRAAADGAMFDDNRILALLAAGVAEVAPGGDVSRDRMDRGVKEIREVVERLPEGHSLAAFAHFSLALALVRRYEVYRDVADLAEMADLLSTVRALADAPDARLWSPAGQMLSFVTDQIGDPVVARDLMVTSLRGFAWSVLLQADVGAAAAAAREAASEAMDVAERCLRDDAPAQAVTALDAGRGLTLFAATEIRDVAQRLAAIGQADLADRWRATVSGTVSGTATKVPLELRQSVLSALVDSDSARLLDPPGIADIQAALTTLGADALVYLMPSRKMMHGMAVVVPARGDPLWTVLPDLMLGEGHDVDRYLDVMAARSASEETRDLKRPTARDVRANLDRVCEWAWGTVIGPVLDLVGRRTPAPTGRDRRLVLVPMGDLARVPWHAARRPDTGRYAFQEAAFSYAASARMLCESARRAPVPLSSLGLIVGDPDAGPGVTDLFAARTEAFAVRQAFYHAARYVGRHPDGTVGRAGAGRRAEVVSWLTSRRPTAGAMLHLACHGVTMAGSDDASSYLLLAGGERLTAEELVGLLADHRDRDIALVVLAACRSGVSTRGYDEAYSLGTTFVAAGVRTVLSTQWSIPDEATSLLMFMFHHYLRAEHRPAWDALRAAQTWMLDPHRKPPDSMPAQLREQLRTTRPDDVLAWAGFVHLGQ